ncbi:nuclear transport factor 2 family protein [Natrialbaceae archaeon GCM10025810]|uniref:nuclear transport factor 2 family protein n=1 Tax=Halovalidus salilacus TaxID=3075124 RepID=UPI0036237297
MVTQIKDSDDLHELLQGTYFDAVDAGDAGTAASAMHPDVDWTHMQVWEHDGHTSRETDSLDGREELRAFLDARVDEMQVVGIEHKVRDIVYEDGRGGFRAEVVGPEGDTAGFIGWVEMTDDLISRYTVAPESVSE